MRYEMLFRHLPDMLTVPQAAKELRIGKNQASDSSKDCADRVL